MKHNNIFLFIAILALGFASCEERIMEWKETPSNGDVTVADLPLPLAEKIQRYESLKNYTDIKLGIGVGMDLYMNDETVANLINENFDDITIGYAMKHGPMVKTDGSIDFTAADAYIQKSKAAGLSTYGHTLVWHSNQNASYLNALIAPTIIPGSAGSNSLDVSGLKDGTLSGWGAFNTGDGITVESNNGLSGTSQAIQLISSASSSDSYQLELISPEIIVDRTHNYEISFYIKSDQPGKGRIAFEGLSNNYPYKDWYATGGDWTEAFETTSTWQQVKITVAPDDFTDSDPFKLKIHLGYLPGVTYHIDVDNFKVIDTDAPVEIENLVANGTFDAGIDDWNITNGGSAFSAAPEAEALNGTGALKVVNTSDTPSEQWRTQIQAVFPNVMEIGKKYTVSLWVRSEATGSFRLSTTNADEGNYSDVHYLTDETTTSTWQQFSYEITGEGYETGLSIDIGGVAGTYYIDDVMVTSGEAASSGPTIIEKTDEEKAEIVAEAMESFIEGMVTHYKDDIKAWDVVNEPIKDGASGEVRDGNVSEPEDDQFYWVKYLGKDYAVTAFKLARQYGNADDVLFINDYNLESNLAKCDGLISYVQYIESQGAQVDGIGTQMHISVTSDRDMIVEMFQKLAASGKQIKISELDIRLGTANPTADQLAEQADMYRFVIEKYMEIIPAAQQYGVTIWGVSDNEQEHEYWLPDESPCLWDEDYARKHAYMGVANGLAGEDVSKGFSGELVY